MLSKSTPENLHSRVNLQSELVGRQKQPKPRSMKRVIEAQVHSVNDENQKTFGPVGNFSMEELNRLELLTKSHLAAY
jgi:hypothetical protein